MACLIKKEKKGRAYYYIVESQRVNGKPRIVNQIYLGTLEKILLNHQSRAAPPAREVELTRFGPAALWDVAISLDLPAMIDQAFPKRNQGPSISQFLLLAALGRAFEPCSKVKIGEWYEKTVLRRRWGHKSSAFTSQRFWDAMDRIDLERLDQLEREISLHIARREDLAPKTFLYDCTNYFTYIDTLNDRNTEALRGRNKQGRHNLRQLGLAVAVTPDFHIPLFHVLYPGNLNDITEFHAVCDDLTDRIGELSGETTAFTLIFDKGNMSEDVLWALKELKIGLIGAVPLDRHPEPARIGLEQFRQAASASVPGVAAWSGKKEIMGYEWTLVLEHSAGFAARQQQSVVTSQAKAIVKLEALAKRLRRGEMPRTTVRSVKAKVREILKGQHLKKIIDTEVTGSNDRPVLDFSLNQGALKELNEHRFGRTLLITNQHDWSAEEIILGYRGLFEVERAFRESKNPGHFSFRPAHHWTDQKLHVHAFYCILSLALTGILRRRLAMLGVDLPTERLLDELHEMQEATLMYPPSKPGPSRLAYTLVRSTKTQKRLFNALDLTRYTRCETSENSSAVRPQSKKSSPNKRRKPAQKRVIRPKNT